MQANARVQLTLAGHTVTWPGSATERRFNGGILTVEGGGDVQPHPVRPALTAISAPTP